jgi:serine/threonine protein kinase
VYLVKEISDGVGQSLNSTVHGGEEAPTKRGSGSNRSGSIGNGKDLRRSIGNQTPSPSKDMVLKVTSILSRQQRDIAEKEAKLLSRLSHPSIIKMFDTCYRTVPHNDPNSRRVKKDDKKDRPQHLILMEFCEGGHALEVCTEMVANGTRFDLSTLIIAFGQICNAVSYLHAQRPPIVHRDLKPANFLVKNGAYKLCDFGSAVFGHVDVKTPKARQEAEEVIEKTTTQMFRSPEMVDLYMAKKLTQTTDVWALGCCLYSLAFLQNCFEEGSNLAILSRKYKIPEDNPYGEGLVELIDRMLTIDCKARADMTEVILCLSAVYSGRPLPPRKERKDKKEKEKEKEHTRSASSGSKDKEKKKIEGAGKFRTTAQGVYGEDLAIDPEKLKEQPAEKKKIDPNSALARRLAAAGAAPAACDAEFADFPTKSEFAADFSDFGDAGFGDDAFGDNTTPSDGLRDAFGDLSGRDTADAFSEKDAALEAWGNASRGKFTAFATFSAEEGVQTTDGNASDKDGTSAHGEGEGEGDDGAENEEEEGVEGESSAHRRRKSSKSRSFRGEEKVLNDDDMKKRIIRRTNSGSRRSRHTSSLSVDDIDVVADCGETEVDGDKDKKIRRKSVRREKSSDDVVKVSSDEIHRGSDGSRREGKRSSDPSRRRPKEKSEKSEE